MEIKMPKLGESVHEGTIEQWLVSVGDKIEEYDPLCEVITDKVTAEVPSSFAGTIREIIVEEGTTVEVGEVICYLDTEEDVSDENTDNGATNDQPEDVKETSQTQESNSNVNNSENAAADQRPQNNGRFSPVVFKLASEHQIDLSQVKGTGFEVRVDNKKIGSEIIAPINAIKINKQVQYNVPFPGSAITVNGVRKQIAENMVNSDNEILHAWMMVEADAINLVNTRNYHKNSFKENEV